MRSDGTRFAVTGHRALADPAAVSAAATAVLRDLPRPLVCVSQLAAGADQLVAEAALAAGAALEAVLPADGYETTLDGADLDQFHRLLAHAALVERLPHRSPTPQAYADAGSRTLEGADLLVAVWDGGASRGAGGTADVVRMAHDRGIRVAVIDARRA